MRHAAPKKEISERRRNFAVLMLHAAVVGALVLTQCGTKPENVNTKFQNTIDWSAPVNPPTAKTAGVAQLSTTVAKALSARQSSGPLAVTGVQSALTVYVLARLDNGPKEAVMADIDDAFFQKCQLAVGGVVSLWGEDELTYFVSYTPPPATSPVIDACKGQEVFQLLKKRQE